MDTKGSRQLGEQISERPTSYAMYQVQDTRAQGDMWSRNCNLSGWLSDCKGPQALGLPDTNAEKIWRPRKNVLLEIMLSPICLPHRWCSYFFQAFGHPSPLGPEARTGQFLGHLRELRDKPCVEVTILLWQIQQWQQTQGQGESPHNTACKSTDVLLRNHCILTLPTTTELRLRLAGAARSKQLGDTWPAPGVSQLNEAGWRRTEWKLKSVKQQSMFESMFNLSRHDSQDTRDSTALTILFSLASDSWRPSVVSSFMTLILGQWLQWTCLTEKFIQVVPNISQRFGAQVLSHQCQEMSWARNSRNRTCAWLVGCKSYATKKTKAQRVACWNSMFALPPDVPTLGLQPAPAFNSINAPGSAMAEDKEKFSKVPSSLLKVPCISAHRI